MQSHVCVGLLDNRCTELKIESWGRGKSREAAVPKIKKKVKCSLQNSLTTLGDDNALWWRGRERVEREVTSATG